MKTTKEWLDAAKAKHGLSDYALAPRLGVTKSQMSRYRTGLDFLSDDAALRLAALLELDDPQPVVASAHAERAKTDEAKAFWRRLAAAAVAGLAVTMGGPPSPAQATEVSASVRYVKRRRNRVMAAMRDALSINNFLPQPA